MNPQHRWALTEDALARRHLCGFLDATADLVIDAKSRINTQDSESFDALKAKQANGHYYFAAS
jgi:hypothetical protein